MSHALFPVMMLLSTLTIHSTNPSAFFSMLLDGTEMNAPDMFNFQWSNSAINRVIQQPITRGQMPSLDTYNGAEQIFEYTYLGSSGNFTVTVSALISKTPLQRLRVDSNCPLPVNDPADYEVFKSSHHLQLTGFEKKMNCFYFLTHLGSEQCY